MHGKLAAIGKVMATGMAIVCLTSAGMADESKPMTAAQRMQARYPQPVRVGDLIGLPCARRQRRDARSRPRSRANERESN